MLAGFRRELLQPPTRSYIGPRCELTVAARLLIRGLRPVRAEAPDFRVPWGTKTLGIECGSAHVRRQRGGTLTHKIGSPITIKQQKPYARPDVALFLDITNICHMRADSTDVLQDEETKEVIQATLQPDKFGSVLCWSARFNLNRNRYGFACIRFDSRNIDPALKALLGHVFPLNEVADDEYAVPLIH